MREYSLILEPNPEDDTYTVTVPALPGCVTQGRTVEECIVRAKEAIAAWIADAQQHGETVPTETKRPQIIFVDVAA